GSLRRADRAGPRRGWPGTPGTAPGRRDRARPAPTRASDGSAARRGAQRVPALALRAPVLPGRRDRRAAFAAVRPVEPAAQAQGAAILVEGVARLPALLEHGAEEGVHDRQVGRFDLELLELLGGLVEHLQLE